MELIIIGENRLKIMLTCEDMARYELSEPCAETMGVRARRALRSIVADAHAQIDFDTDSERLLVQLFASREGGCEIFVTRLEEPGEVKLLRALSVEGDLSGGENVRPLWLRLESLGDVTALCRRLMSAGYRGGGSICGYGQKKHERRSVHALFISTYQRINASTHKYDQHSHRRRLRYTSRRTNKEFSKATPRDWQDNNTR
jgi:hypothetical protein